MGLELLAARNILHPRMRVALLSLLCACVGVELPSIYLDLRFTPTAWERISSSQSTLVNLTNSLLTVQPTEEALDQFEGYYSCGDNLVPVTVEGNRVNLIAIDPKTAFIVRNWLQGSTHGSLKSSDILAGSAVSGQAGEALFVCGRSMNMAGRLGKTGVGLFDESYFAAFSALNELMPQANVPNSMRPLQRTTLHEHGGAH